MLANLWRRSFEAYQDWRFGKIDTTGPIGKRGEQAAARFLRQKGLTIIAHSESDRGGEIDLIAAEEKSKTIIFVEVKTTATKKPGHPAERVDERKQRQIARAALRYLKRKKVLGVRARFDVVAVWWTEGGKDPEKIEHYESAFEMPTEFQMF
jgi:putative endonuclease